ncbi:hypothetical protein B7L88_gp124 [Rhizobium phage RHEph10]|uniref:hypothetical protein n=1 Tax=Rhizobium phage RHEph10 TaxID=1220717 RepID=UPI0002AB04BF|nr:hypothetical protein B7L88_gp124 [Rhizobium phage RHEph10]AGC36164.1 hypothetical protein RHEph10_gp121 [Rhizobium phage RHEph10]
MRTDEQIVMETNDLARLMLGELVGTGYVAPDGHKFWEAADPRSQKAWAAAVKAMELITKTEVEDALNNYLADLEAKPKVYRSPTGNVIVGTAETVLALAQIIGINQDGTPEYEGGTTIHWDTQRTLTRDGKILFTDEAGEDWTFDQLTENEEDTDGDQ